MSLIGNIKQAIEDLLTWEEENDQLLPEGWTAEAIAMVESQGYVVDLETGETMTEAEAEVSGFTVKR